jgi:streptogramin lyase
MLKRFLIVSLLGVQMACGAAGGTAQSTPSPAATCNPLQVKVDHYTLTPSTSPTTGFDLHAGTQAVGIIADHDGSSVWLLGTGSDTVLHVTTAGAATAYALPPSGLGLQMSQAGDGTVWVPEQHRGAVASIAPDGSARECTLGAGREPYATAVATDGSVWITEQRGGAIARLVDGKITEYPMGITNAKGMEVLAAKGGGAWFTVDGAPVLGEIDEQGHVKTIEIGGSGTYIGLLEAPDGSVYVADFDGDRVVRVGNDGHGLTEWKTSDRSGTQERLLVEGCCG